jgi:hypothetical protein
MGGPNKHVIRFGSLKEREAHHRRLVHVDAGISIKLEKFFEPNVPLTAGQITTVLKLEIDFDVSVDFLDGFFNVFPAEACAQNRVSIYNTLARRFE